MGRCLVFVSAILLSFSAARSVRADMVLAGWNFHGLAGFGPSPMAPTTRHPRVGVGGLQRGAGVTTSGTAAANAWGGTGWDSPSFAAALGAQDFATFSLAPVDGYLLSLSSIDPYNIRRSATGPTTGQWQYQIGEGGFFNLGSQITWGSTTTSAGNNQSEITLTEISDLQSISETVTFRLVNWDASNSSGTWYFNSTSAANDLVIQGTVTSVPEPGALLMVAAAGTVGIAGRRYRRRRGQMPAGRAALEPDKRAV
jgi:hypothetical protein